MTRRLLNLPAVASVILCAAAAALWARSYSRAEWFYIEFGTFDVYVITAPGAITVKREQVYLAPLGFYGMQLHGRPARYYDDNPDPPERWGFAVHREGIVAPDMAAVRFPHWAVVVVAAGVPWCWGFGRGGSNRG